MSSESDAFIYEYLKEDYDRETERYSRYRDRVSFVSGFVLLLGTGISTLLTSYQIDFQQYSTRDAIFLSSIVCSLCFFVMTLYYLYLAAIPQFSFANVEDGEAMWKSYCDWAKYEQTTKNTKNIESLFRKSISQSFAKASTINRKRTVERSKLLALAIRTAVISGIILIAPATCNVLKSQEKSNPDPVRVEVISPIKIKQSHER